MAIRKMWSASFDELKNYKISLRKQGKKNTLRYENVVHAMRVRFGRD